MDDAGLGRDDAEVVECLLAPSQERIAFAVALELQFGVAQEGEGAAGEVDMDGVVDDEVDRDEGVDLLGITAETLDGVAHGGKVDHARHSGEVLQDDPARDEGNFAGFARGVRGPCSDAPDIGLGDGKAIGLAENGLQEDLDGVREFRQVGDCPGAFEGVEAVVGHVAVAGLEGFAGVEEVVRVPRGGGGVGRRHAARVAPSYIRSCWQDVWRGNVPVGPGTRGTLGTSCRMPCTIHSPSASMMRDVSPRSRVDFPSCMEGTGSPSCQMPWRMPSGREINWWSRRIPVRCFTSRRALPTA